jgi:serine/threonine-protein kinase
MGVVWKAEDTVLGRTVAIKVLPADLALDEERGWMFLDEARLAASVSHAHIIQVHELGREGDLDFIVMEYVEGQPLNKLLRGKPLPPDKLADWGLQAAEGLARAHRNGLIHRDLKPPTSSSHRMAR